MAVARTFGKTWSNFLNLNEAGTSALFKKKVRVSTYPTESGSVVRCFLSGNDLELGEQLF
jgi:hypothetical protein